MFDLQTERLRLIPLNLEALRLLLDDRQKMERYLGLTVTDVVLDEPVRQAIERDVLKGVAENEEDYLWYTNWEVVLKEENCSIGGLAFKGPPNREGEVEVGYGLQPPYRGKGYMTEAMREAFRWAFEEPRVQAFIGEVEKTNLPSIRVLQRLGMARNRETERFYYYRLSRESNR